MRWPICFNGAEAQSLGKWYDAVSNSAGVTLLQWGRGAKPRKMPRLRTEARHERHWLQWGRGAKPRKIAVLPSACGLLHVASMGPRRKASENDRWLKNVRIIDSLQWGRGAKPRKITIRARRSAGLICFNGAEAQSLGKSINHCSAARIDSCFNGAEAQSLGKFMRSAPFRYRTTMLQWGRGAKPRKIRASVILQSRDSRGFNEAEAQSLGK